MEELNSEERDLLEALAGRKSATPGEAALRATLLQFARDSHEAAELSKMPPTEDQLQQTERLRQALIDGGALPAIQSVPDKAALQVARPKASPSAMDALFGLLGRGKRSSGALGTASAIRWLPAGALAIGALALLYALSQGMPQRNSPIPDVTRGQGAIIKAAVPSVKCAEIAATLISSGISRDAITQSTPQNSCTLSVRGDEPRLQAETARVFREAGATVAPSARMELSVIPE